MSGGVGVRFFLRMILKVILNEKIKSARKNSTSKVAILILKSSVDLKECDREKAY